VEKCDEIIRFFLLKMVSVFSKNPCPFSAGMGVRNQQETVSVFTRNHCPDWAGIGVRFGQEYAAKAK